MVWRGPGQVSGSLTRPDLSCDATFLPEDPTLAPLVLSLPTGDRGFESVSLQQRVRSEPDFGDPQPHRPASVSAVIRTLRAILAKLRPEPAREPLHKKEALRRAA
jgi:hypothetical protein